MLLSRRLLVYTPSVDQLKPTPGVLDNVRVRRVHIGDGISEMGGCFAKHFHPITTPAKPAVHVLKQALFLATTLFEKGIEMFYRLAERLIVIM